MRIVNERDGRVVADNVEIARSFTARLVGLIGRRSLSEGSALIIPGCRQVHTLLMRFPIDIIMTDAGGRVVSITENLSPGRLSGYCRPASQSVELPAGRVAACGVRSGDILRVEGAD